MINFNHDYTDEFLATVRKYMQLRGGLSQKDLAESLRIGISTMSRFLNQKTKDLDPQLIANIIASLQIPLHEVIDFVDEESTLSFKKLVQFYREQKVGVETAGDEEDLDSLEQGLDDSSTRAKTSISINGTKIPFGEKKAQEAPQTIREKLNDLSPRQKGFLTDFLDLDVEGKDLIVDVANSLVRYFKQANTDF
jgi:transcriptional regulator with XRE-family HTH domain